MGKKIVSASTLAVELGISARRIGQLVALGVLPREDRNQYPLAACREAYQKFKAASDAGSETAYLQYLKISNDLLAAQNAVRSGAMIDRTDYIQTISRPLQSFRARLLTLPVKAAPLLVGNSDAGSLSILKRLVNEARRELTTDIDFHSIAREANRKKNRRR
ncbi:MAG: hypothetical protein JXA07_12705 [Spirochaetes bacterium]|nr:hypothetical protein [Spirochaetota bacterium]